MPRSLPAILLILLLVGAGVAGALYLLDDDGTPQDEVESMSAGDEAPALSGRANERDEAAVENTEAEAPVAEPPKHTWRLALVVREFKTPMEYVHHFDPEEIAEDCAERIKGSRWAVHLHRGGTSRELATVKLDKTGRATIDLPALDALGPLGRAASSLVAVPVTAGFDIGPEGPGWFGAEASAVVSIPARPQSDTVTLPMVVPVLPEDLLRGRVVDGDGKPVEGAHVRAWGGDAWAGQDCTDADGRFGIYVTKGGTLELNVWARGLLHAERKDLRVTEGARVDLGTITLEPDGRIRGRVTYKDGAPVSGVGVNMRRLSFSRGSPMLPTVSCQGNFDGISTRTDAKGHWSVAVGEARWWPSLTLNGPTQPTQEGEPGFGLAVFDGVASAEVVYVVDAHRLRVRVVDEHGKPVPGAEVRAKGMVLPKGIDKKKPWSGEVRTSAKGVADFWVPHGDEVTLSVVMAGAAPVSRVVTAPAEGNETTVSFSLQPISLTSGIRPWLTDTTGRSLFPATVTVSTKAGAPVWSSRLEEPGAFIALAPGEYRVRMKSAEKTEDKISGTRWLSTSTELTVGEDQVEDVRATPVAACFISFIITGKPEPKEGEESPWGYDDPEITFTHRESGKSDRTWIFSWEWDLPAPLHETLRAGTYELVIRLRGFRKYRTSVTLEPGQVAKLDVHLEVE